MADNINKLIKSIEAQNEILKELINENNRLTNTPFDMTSLDRLKELSAKVAELGQTFEQSFSNAGALFSDLFTDKSKIIEDMAAASTKLAQELKKVQKAKEKISTLEDELEEAVDRGDKKEIANIKRRITYQKKIVDKYEKQKEVLADLQKDSTKYYRKANEEQKILNKRIVEGTTSLDDFGERMEQRTRALRKGVGEIIQGGKKIYESVTKTLEPWTKANDAAMTYARNMGMSQKTADAYMAKTVSWAAKNNIGILFNKSTEELIKMQGKYSEVLGRNVQLTSEQKMDMLAMEKFLGEDGMMDIANNLENFGLGMSDSAEFVHKTMSEATKSGVAASKLTKTIRENIKMAQNYTFKNGLDGLTSMAKKAVELKTDMSLVNSFLEKVSTVEGAITTGAHLQVLGGNYAMGSDPLSMMYESLNDTEGLFDRAVNMANGKVFYNQQTGNFEMGAMDRYMMKQAATVMGIDPSKLIDVAFRKASLNKIEGEAMANSRIANDEEMISLIKNIATWNDGHAVVNIDGKDKAVSDLTSADKEKLEAMQRTDSQNLQEMAISLRSLQDIFSGEEKEVANEQASAVHTMAQSMTNMLKNNTEMLDTVAKIGAWGNIIKGAFGVIGGIWMTVNGILRSMHGVGNLMRGGGNGGDIDVGRRGVGRNRGFIGRGKQFFRVGKSHGFKGIARMGKTAVRGVGRNITSGFGRTAINGAGKVLAGGTGAAIGGVAGAAISLGTDIVTGDFKKDTGASIGRAVGTGVGAAIGGIFGPVGAMIGGFIGGAVTGAVQDVQKKNRARIREDIASKLEESSPDIAKLFVGDNALQGNYNKSQLAELEKALADNVINEGELSKSTLRKARANGDMTRMEEHGVRVIAMAKGGYLNGEPHYKGGMRIAGSNIEVEGGEFVVNKKDTKNLRPFLERMNKGDYSMIAKEPLGQQMRVSNHKHNGTDMPHNSKITIEPVSINLTGTIKLESNGKQIDISNELLNNPVLINKLTEMISKQINIIENSAYNKNTFKQKFA